MILINIHLLLIQEQVFPAVKYTMAYTLLQYKHIINRTYAMQLVAQTNVKW